MLLITAVALPVGAAGAVASFLLLRLIGLITNAVFYHRVATSLVAPGAIHHPALLILAALAVGGLVVGFMARFGSEKIRGHGMPAATRDEHVVEATIARLRTALGSDGDLILTVTKRGYRLAVRP